MGVFKAAAVQMRASTEIGRNASDFERLVREAAAKGAVYVQTPEMTGALMRDKNALLASLKADDQDLIAAAARRLAAELGIHIHVGSTAIARSDGKVANRAFLFGPDGGLVARYDKIHMFDVDLDNGESWRESDTYEPGASAAVVDLCEYRPLIDHGPFLRGNSGQSARLLRGDLDILNHRHEAMIESQDRTRGRCARRRRTLHRGHGTRDRHQGDNRKRLPGSKDHCRHECAHYELAWSTTLGR